MIKKIKQIQILIQICEKKEKKLRSCSDLTQKKRSVDMNQPSPHETPSNRFFAHFLHAVWVVGQCSCH